MALLAEAFACCFDVVITYKLMSGSSPQGHLELTFRQPTATKL